MEKVGDGARESEVLGHGMDGLGRTRSPGEQSLGALAPEREAGYPLRHREEGRKDKINQGMVLWRCQSRWRERCPFLPEDPGGPSLTWPTSFLSSLIYICQVCGGFTVLSEVICKS